MKTYRIVINGQVIQICAKTINISRKRCNTYLNNLLKETDKKFGSHRFFWADVIMLNMLTNKILYHSDPQHIEKMLAPKGEKGIEDE